MRFRVPSRVNHLDSRLRSVPKRLRAGARKGLASTLTDIDWTSGCAVSIVSGEAGDLPVRWKRRDHQREIPLSAGVA